VRAAQEGTREGDCQAYRELTDIDSTIKTMRKQIPLKTEASKTAAEVAALEQEAAGAAAKLARDHEIESAVRELDNIEKKILSITNQLNQIRQSLAGFETSDSLREQFERAFTQSIIADDISDHFRQKAEYTRLARAIHARDLCVEVLTEAEALLDADLQTLTERQRQLNAVRA
jgi:hypothetical protein